MTSAEAEARKIPVTVPAPEPVTCKYCGRTLYHEGMCICGKISIWSPSPQRCDCSEASRYWEVEDERRAKEKADAEEKAKREARKARIDRLIGNSGMKKRFLTRTFDTYVHDTREKDLAWRICRRYVEMFDERAKTGKGLYIYGGYGTGKTHLAAAVSLELMAQMRTVVFRSANDLFSEARDMLRESNTATERDVVQAYKECDLLVIDDLGKEKCTEWTLSFLFGILDDRYEQMRPVIITSNYSPEAIAGRLVTERDTDRIKAIVSRFGETVTPVKMNWEDHRKESEKK